MISNLAIKNYALIDDIDVAFHGGHTIITGETGAGKSILLGALSLLLGKRADLSAVKDPDKKCVIEGVFQIATYQLESLFEEQEMDYEPVTIIRREILPGGKSRAFVNDSPVGLTQLQTLGIHLVDVHSQHETLSLMSETFQMEVVDILAGNEALLMKYQKELASFQQSKEQLAELKKKQANVEKELDYNTFLYEELQEAGLSGIDQQELEEEYETLNNTEVIQETLASILKWLSEESAGSLETAKEARIALGKLQKYRSDFSAYWDRLNSMIIELEDIYEGLTDVSDQIEADPERLFETHSKLQKLYKLQQKHNVNTVSELFSIEQELQEKITGMQSLEARITTLEKKVTTYSSNASEIASQLHKHREQALPGLKEQLESILLNLGLPNARFRFELSEGKDFKKNGMDTLELLFTANKGLAFGPLKKVASGGELSRIMLAVKAVLASYKKLPTIIFDEIDTGVSGEIANQMATIMARMSKDMQLFTITHLPQIAAKGEHHIKVYKEDFEERTVTRLKTLDSDARIVEIAQMIGGKNLTDAALANARELMN